MIFSSELPLNDDWKDGKGSTRVFEFKIWRLTFQIWLEDKLTIREKLEKLNKESQ